jgi:alpha-N-arabinofuranosidase
MTGLERNADVVQMCSYAPLFAHIDAWQWRPDLIWFDNLRSIGTPNYYVQKLFSINRGTDVVPVLQDGEVLAGKDSLYASAVIDRKTKAVIIKLVNASAVPVALEINIDGKKIFNTAGSITELSATDLFYYNALDQQRNIYPVGRLINADGQRIVVDVKPRSVNVIKVPCEF